MSVGKIEIVGARTNNLRSVDVSLPLRKATMVVGVSGSGKSSLLADTLAAEANVRMRRFLGVHQLHAPPGAPPSPRPAACWRSCVPTSGGIRSPGPKRPESSSRPRRLRATGTG